MSTIAMILVLMLGVLLYLLPSIVAQLRRHKNNNSICILNIFLGWTFLGWVVALSWAFSANVEIADEKPKIKKPDFLDFVGIPVWVRPFILMGSFLLVLIYLAFIR